jgi:predicted RNA-binding Zn-ribbon protein involved in translation (DUF1610 family)
MRALSVKQPWAELIARGKKKKEFRTWSRSCFGDLLIVASKAVDADAIEDEGLDMAARVFGRAVCVVDFYKVTGDEGDYAWHLRNPRRVEPIEVRGSASLYHVPDERIRFVDDRSAAPTSSGRQKATRTTCPKCGAGKPIPIVYGEPGRDLWAEHERGDIELGGCVVTFGVDPIWRCRSCREAFGNHAQRGRSGWS